jgi:NADH-quinone oxidoreductase subunit E
MAELEKIIEKYRTEQGSIVGVLQDISEAYGYLPEEVLHEVSRELEVPLSLLYSLSSFYASFRLEPRGDHHLCVCVGTACHVRGAQRIVDALERDLRIKAGETTVDRKFTVETVNCLGACALGPLVVLDGDYHGKMDQKKVSSLLKKAQAAQKEDDDS